MATPQREYLISSPFLHRDLIQMWGPGATPSPQGSRAPAPEPSNGEQAGQHTTYPELLELGPGQGRVGRGGAEEDSPLPAGLEWGRQVSLSKSHTLSGPDIPHLSKSHVGLSGLVGGAWGLKTDAKSITPPHAQPLTWWTTPSISTGMMKSALFTGCGRGGGEEELLELRHGPRRPPSQARAGTLRDPGLRAAGQGPP